MATESGSHIARRTHKDIALHGKGLVINTNSERGIKALRTEAPTEITPAEDLIRAAALRADITSGVAVQSYFLEELDTPRVLRGIPDSGDIVAIEAMATALDIRDQAKTMIEGEVFVLQDQLSETDKELRRGAAFYPAAIDRVDELAVQLEGHKDTLPVGTELYQRFEDGVTTVEHAKETLLVLPGEVKGFASAVRKHDPDFAFEGSNPPRLRTRDRSTFEWPEELARAVEIADHFGVSPRIVGEMLVDMEGRQNFGGMGVGFPREEAMALMPELLKEKAAAPKRRRAADTSVENRSPLTELSEAHGITVETGRRIVSQYALDFVKHGQNSAKFYNDDAFAAAIAEDAKKKAAPQGRYEKEDGVYVNLNYIFETLGINHYTARDRLGGIPTDTGRQNETTYKWDEGTQARLAPLVETPRADATTGIYTDPSSRRIAPMNILQKMTGLSVDKLKQFVEGEYTTDVIARSGQLVSGYDVDSVLQKAAGYTKRRPPK